MPIPPPPPPPAIAFAASIEGVSPQWSLRRAGGEVVLTVAGAPPRRLGPGRWQDAPAGRRLLFDGGVMLEIAHALCPAAPGGRREGRISYLTIGGARLRGCYLDTAPHPYPG